MRLFRVILTLTAVALVSAASAPTLMAQTPGVRQVTATTSFIPLQTRMQLETLIVLPEGEDIVEVSCGNKDFWIINVSDTNRNVAHVRPAKEGASTDLTLTSSSGAMYSFYVTEKAGTGMPDLKVFISADPDKPSAKPRYVPASQLDDLRSQLAQAQTGVEAAQRRANEAIAAYQEQYPTQLQFAYGPLKYEAPFYVTAIWHDGRFTYIKADGREAPVLYEVKDGQPSLVNFQVRGGTYVVPKVLERGYLALGKSRFAFGQRGR